MEQKWLDGNEGVSQPGVFHYLELCMKGWSAFPLKLTIFRGLCSAVNIFQLTI